ncbi:MAG: response regulator [Candidatus Omnitrophica bacterium]|nr:response regulator [Candidatus Omnitrophota bacterium]
MARTVLVVDDERKIRDTYNRLLTSEGFKVLEAENGEQASLMLIEPVKIDLILLDIRMPVVSGPALFDVIKVCRPESKVIVTSVFPLEDQKRVIDRAEGYHDKAEGTQTLLSKIKNVLRGRTADAC